MRSLYWGRFCKVMFYVTLANVLMLHFVLKEISIDPHDLAYIGASMTSISGLILGITYKYQIYKLSDKHKSMVLYSLSMIIILLLIEAILNLRVQILFNHFVLRDTVTHALFKYIIVSSTILQIIISLRGGIDGRKRIRESYINIFNNFSFRSYLYHSIAGGYSKFKKRIGKL